MAAIIPKSLQISHHPFPFPSTLTPRPSLKLPIKPPRAATEDDPPPPPPNPDEAAFESRLSQVRLKYRSGTGKKAERRRAKKDPTAAGKKNPVMLPPIPLSEPVSAAGMAVELGFTPYSEWLNGRLAGLGLAALVLVELGAGKGLLAYHSPAIIFVQIYTVAAAGAVFVKYEKERISVWPETPPPTTQVAGD